MVSMSDLWLSTLLAAVIVFLASSVLHMMLRYHRSDFAPLPDEEAGREGLRKANAPPGDYILPHAADPKELGSPEMKKKLAEGPVAFVTVLPNGPIRMGASLVQWFVYCVAISAFVAYLTSRTVDPGAEYLAVFRVAGAAAFLGYAGAAPVASIWGKRRWSTSAKHVFDGLVYGVLTAGAFAGFWPEAL